MASSQGRDAESSGRVVGIGSAQLPETINVRLDKQVAFPHLKTGPNVLPILTTVTFCTSCFLANPT